MKKTRKAKVVWTTPPMTKAEKWGQILPPWQNDGITNDHWWIKPDGSSLKIGELYFLRYDSKIWNDKVGLMWTVPPLVRMSSYSLGESSFARAGSACIYAGHMRIDEDKNHQAYRSRPIHSKQSIVSVVRQLFIVGGTKVIIFNSSMITCL